jgi:hypothetical protein
MNGCPIWVGAATHDVGIKFEMRKLWMIHRIDLVTQEKYLSSAVPIFQAQTASGEAYHSDSRLLLLDFSQDSAPMLAGIQATNHTLAGPLLSFAK